MRRREQENNLEVLRTKGGKKGKHVYSYAVRPSDSVEAPEIPEASETSAERVKKLLIDLEMTIFPPSRHRQFFQDKYPR